MSQGWARLLSVSITHWPTKLRKRNQYRMYNKPTTEYRVGMRMLEGVRNTIHYKYRDTPEQRDTQRRNNKQDGKQNKCPSDKPTQPPSTARVRNKMIWYRSYRLQHHIHPSSTHHLLSAPRTLHSTTAPAPCDSSPAPPAPELPK